MYSVERTTTKREPELLLLTLDPRPPLHEINDDDDEFPRPESPSSHTRNPTQLCSPLARLLGHTTWTRARPSALQVTTTLSPPSFLCPLANLRFSYRVRKTRRKNSCVSPSLPRLSTPLTSSRVVKLSSGPKTPHLRRSPVRLSSLFNRETIRYGRPPACAHVRCRTRRRRRRRRGDSERAEIV